jgi:hypothetical protein
VNLAEPRRLQYVIHSVRGTRHAAGKGQRSRVLQLFGYFFGKPQVTKSPITSRPNSFEDASGGPVPLMADDGVRAATRARTVLRNSPPAWKRPGRPYILRGQCRDVVFIKRKLSRNPISILRVLKPVEHRPPSEIPTMESFLSPHAESAFARERLQPCRLAKSKPKR